MASIGTARLHVEADISETKVRLARDLRAWADELDPPKLDGAVLEIIERTDDPDPMVLVPNEIRINGAKLLASADEPVVVHEVSTAAHDHTKVTLTLLVKRVTMRAEPKVVA